MNPHAPAQRRTLRALGVLAAAIGGIFAAIGLFDFLGSMSGGGPPARFWCLFVGVPLLGIGLSLLRFGYMGAIGRYVAGEAAPIAGDVINEVGHRAAPGIEAVARSISTGMQQDEVAARCGACGAAADGDARFCDQCGADLISVCSCPACERENDADAQFCDHCGERLLRG